MSLFRKLLIVGVGVLALHGVEACSTETGLNPQPLPPQGGESSGDPTQSPSPAKDPGDDTTGAGGTSGTATPPQGASDAGAEGGDAADGGDR